MLRDLFHAGDATGAVDGVAPEIAGEKVSNDFKMGEDRLLVLFHEASTEGAMG